MSTEIFSNCDSLKQFREAKRFEKNVGRKKGATLSQNNKKMVRGNLQSDSFLILLSKSALEMRDEKHKERC